MKIANLVDALLLLILITACNSLSSQHTEQKELQTILSWTATAYRVGEAWKQKAIPKAYTKSLSENF